MLGTIVYLQRLTLRNWDIAFATVGYFPLVQECSFENNGIGIDVRTGGNALRVEGCAFTGNSGNAINLNAPGTGIVSPPVDANSVLVTRCTFGGNGRGIYVDRHQGARIIGNAFIGNTSGGVYVTANAREARIVANFFDNGDRFGFEDGDMGTRVSTHHHQWGFNAVGDPSEMLEDPAPETLAVELVWPSDVLPI
ncbi:MAG: right-handed parallel beta-helix repeat-containing protein [Nannocystaceae bacterium]